MTKLESYLARCEAAVMPLTNGKKITVPVAVLQDHKVDAAQWRIDLHNAIAVDFYDPADCCLEGSSTPCYKVSVLVRQGQAIASAKEVFDGSTQTVEYQAGCRGIESLTQLLPSAEIGTAHNCI